MQLIRMVSLIILGVFTVVFFYIFVRYTLNFYNFYSLLFTTLAFYFLFIGSGK
jgi:hypothetical protein